MKLTKIAFFSTLLCTIKVICIALGVFLTFPSLQSHGDNSPSVRVPIIYASEKKEDTPPTEVPQQAPILTENELSEREKALEEKEKELRALEETVTASLNKIEVAQKRLTDLINQLKGEQDKQLQHLIDVYSNMKPQQAGMVLETLDEMIAVKILSGMKGRKAGEILSFVEPKKAAKLSERLTQIQMNSTK